MTAALAFDQDEFKRAAREQWDIAAGGWNDNGAKIRAWLREATDAMLAMADVQSGGHVLDVAAGAGDQTLDVAARVGPNGHVLATDLSPAILALARDNLERAGLRNVETRVAAGDALPAADGTFDAVISRLGLMFFPDPLRSLREMRRVLRPAGGICTVVFSTIEANPCLAILMSTALKHAGLPPRDPYQPGSLLSLGRPGAIDALFAKAEFREIATTRLSAPFRLPSARDYLAFIRTSASPVLHILGRLSPAAQQAAWDEMADRLRQFDGATGWEGPNELLLTAARR